MSNLPTYLIVSYKKCIEHLSVMAAMQGRIQDLIRGGPQIVTGLKLPFWGLNFVEFWCWGLIFGDQGGAWDPPWIRPWP